jgi:hypothetical protein
MTEEVTTYLDTVICNHCGYPVSITNPSGFCNHVHYPDNCVTCKNSNYPCTHTLRYEDFIKKDEFEL